MNGDALPAPGLQSLLERIRDLPSARAAYDLALDLCHVAGVDRATIYQTAADGSALLCKMHHGPDFPEIRMSITNRSIPGFVAGARKAVTFRDVYDDSELARHSPDLRFGKGVDQKTGYRTRQMLVAPVLDGDSGELLGVVELVNPKSGLPFSPQTESLVGHVVLALASRLQELREVS